MAQSSSKPTTPHSTSATPPAKHSPSGSAGNAVGRAATGSGGQSGQPDNGGSWTGEMEGNRSKPAAEAPQGAPVDTSPSGPKDGGPNHGNYKGG